MSLLSTYQAPESIKKTISRCPICRAHAPAEVLKVYQNGCEQIIMRRTCEEHGEHDFIISSDARFYWLAQGNPINSACGCGSTCYSAGKGKDGYLGDNALNEAKHGTMDRLSTCLALIEIVDSCNLSCPTCFADSPLGVKDHKLKYHSFEKLTERIQGILDQKNHIEILQFSGGEPTIHPEFFRLVEWVRQNPDIDYLLINTNGVRLAKDKDFLQQTGELIKKYDNFQLYLQFDGPQEAGQMELRGTDLRKIREQAIKNCAAIDLPITLAMTVTPTTLNHLWETAEYARKFENIRGISFQPMFLSGRRPNPKDLLPQPITSADVILALHQQSNGLLSLDDFTPLPCGDPNCSIIGWLFRVKNKFYSPAKFGIDLPALQSNFPDRVNYDIEDLKKCGCDDTPLGNLMKSMEVKESNAFRLFIKPFMDERTWDEDRIDRCCTHVIRPDGKLDSFCRYYFGS